MKRHYRKAMPLAVAWTVNSLAYSIIYPFLPIYLSEKRGYPMELVGLIYPVMGFSVMVGPLLAGWMVDKIGRLPVMRYGQSVRAGVFFLLGTMVYFNAPLWLFAIMLGVNSAVGTFFQVGADAYLSDITTQETRPAAYSLIRIGTNIGWAIGPALGAFFLSVPFWVMFCITSGLCLVGDQYTKYTCRARQRKPGAEDKKNVFSVRRMLHDRTIVGLLIATLSLFFLVSQLYTLLAVYSTSVVGISSKAMGYVYSLNGLVIISCQIPLIKLLDRCQISQRCRMVSGCVLYIMGFYSFGFARNVWMVAAGVIILTLGEVIVKPSIYTTIVQLAPADGVGRYLSALGLITGIGYAAGPYLGSLAYKYVASSPLILWGILCGFAVFAMVIYAIVINDRKKNGDAETCVAV